MTTEGKWATDHHSTLILGQGGSPSRKSKHFEKRKNTTSKGCKKGCGLGKATKTNSPSSMNTERYWSHEDPLAAKGFWTLNEKSKAWRQIQHQDQIKAPENWHKKKLKICDERCRGMGFGPRTSCENSVKEKPNSNKPTRVTSPETLPQRFYSAFRTLLLSFHMLLQWFSASLITPTFAKLLSQ